MPEYITVTAPKDRKVPINPNDGTDPNGTILFVTSEGVTRVRYSQDVRRSINRGDLIPCTLDGKKCDLEKANSPKAMHVGSHATDEDLYEARLKPRPLPKLEDKGPTPNMDASKSPTFDTSDNEGKR